MPLDADLPLLAALEETAAGLLERHLDTAKEWYPHEIVPWGAAEDYPADYEWSPDDTEVPAAVRSALFVNTLTEENLPYYFRDIERMFGRDGAWGEWVRRWTAEEGRHGMVMTQYLYATRALDPVELEQGRMVQVCGGEVPEPLSAADGLAYVSMQELATRIAHFNTGQHMTDEAGKAVMRRVALDENLHFLFYRDAMSAIIELDPSSAVLAIERQVRGFAMPGTGIPGFTAHAKAIADHGIYDTQIHHDQILQPVVVRDWGVGDLEGLTGEAEEAREALMNRIERTGRLGRKLAERRAERSAATPEPAGV